MLYLEISENLSETELCHHPALKSGIYFRKIFKIPKVHYDLKSFWIP
jgi:hypothetical protein